MGATTDRFTRFDGRLVEAAAIEGARHSRSTRQQLEHWVRLGAALPAHLDVPSNRVRLALDGTIAQRDLSAGEAKAFDAEVARRIEAAVARADFSSAPLPNFSSAPLPNFSTAASTVAPPAAAPPDK